MSRQPRWAAIAIVVALSSAQQGCGPPSHSTLVVCNRTDERLSRVVVTIRGDKVELGNLPAGGCAVRSLRIGPESGYEVAAEFASGRTMQDTVGYVTSGFSFHDSLFVMADRCEIVGTVVH